MTSIRNIVAILAAMAAIVLPATAQTADEIVSKAIAARGGIEKLKTVHSEKITGHITLGPDAEGPFTVQRERPPRSPVISPPGRHASR